MEERKCPCGGTMRPLGRREIRMGPTSPLGRDPLRSYSLEVEMFVCQRCCELKLFLPEELAFELTHSAEELCMRKFMDHSDEELRRIVESSYQPEARKAAAALLKQRSGLT